MLDDISDMTLSEVRSFFYCRDAKPEDRVVYLERRLSDLTDLLLKELADHERTRDERDMLAQKLVQRPSATVLVGMMMARADEAGAFHASDMIEVLQTIGGHV